MTSRSLSAAILCAIFGLSGPLTADEPVNAAPLPGTPEFLRDVLQKQGEESGRWAFTETTTTVLKSKKYEHREEVVVRFDPSLPYEAQFTPLKIKGKEPTEAQRKKYRHQGERRGQQLEAAMRKDGVNSAPSAQTNAAPQASVGGRSVTVDLDHAKVVAEDATSLTYEVPFQGSTEGVSVDKFQILIRINREHRVIGNAELKLKAALRVKLIAKINTLESRYDFTTIDPQFVPQLTSISATGTGKVMFIKGSLTIGIKHTDLQRVKPYSERFGVKVGPVKLLDFLQ
jgi:hypothetical protein